MSEYAEEEEIVKYPEVMGILKIMGICREFHKLPHEVKEEDRWTIDMLSLAIRTVGKKTEKEMEKQRFLEKNRGR